jgi:type IV secretion system protein VirD4
MSAGSSQNLPYRTPEVPKGFGGYHWPTLVRGLFLLLLSNVLATQFVAFRFDNATALGRPLAIVGALHLYAPWQWAPWFLRYTRSAIPFVKNTVGLSILIVTLGCVVTFIFTIVSNFRRSKAVLEDSQDLHGSARFATRAELAETGVLNANEGVYIGGYRDGDYIKYLRHGGKEHLICVAPTRSGKGVGIVIPTLLAWTESVIVYDIKGENWALTAGYRSQELGQRCLKFSPLEDDTCHFNPLDLIRAGTPHEVADAQKVAEMLVDTGDSVTDRYFLESAEQLATAFILHLLYEARIHGYNTPSPADVLDLATGSGQDIYTVMEVLRTYPHRRLSDKPFPGETDMLLTTHPVVAGTMATMLAKGSKEFGSILGSLTRPLRVYQDPLVRNATRFSDFKVRDLVDTPMSLYLVIPPNDKRRLKSLVRILLTMVVNELTAKMDFQDGATKKNPYRLLFLIDEFPALGRMQLFADALSYMAGYGLRAYLIIQDIPQLTSNDAYGHDQSIISNCHVRVVYTPNNEDTAQLFSRMTGKRTIQQATVSYSGSRTSTAQNQMTTSINYIERELLTADEISSLPSAKKINAGTPEEKIVAPGDLLIFMGGVRPIYGVQILFFIDPEFVRRSKIPAPAGPPPARLTGRFRPQLAFQSLARPKEDPDASTLPILDLKHTSSAEEASRERSI